MYSVTATMAASSSSSSDCECGLLSLPTETLFDIVSYLTAYERLCLRISCKRLYSIISDPRAWYTLVWKDCRRRESDFKALRLALRLSRPTVQSITIIYLARQRLPFSKFIPQIHSCKQVRFLTLSGKLLNTSMLSKLLSQLPSLHFLSITVGDEKFCRSIFTASSEAKNLTILRLVYVRENYYTPFMQVIDSWRRCGYFPPDVQVYDSVGCLESLSLSYLSNSEHPAKFSFYPKCSSAAGNLVNNYPLFEIVFYPNVKVVSCAICPSSPDSPMLILCNGRTCVSSEESCDYISATYVEYRWSSPLPSTSLPLLPPTIQSLCLAKLAELTSADLSSISECCPNLMCLNIRGCSKALLSLSGLADVSEKCAQLTSLNITSIIEVESVATLWEVLASMKKLRHLAMSGLCCFPERVEAPKNAKGARVSHILPFDEHSLSRVRKSVARMSLTAFEVSFSHDITYPLQLEIFSPAFQRLNHLYINGCAPCNLTNVLPNMPYLSHLALTSRSTITLPTDVHCYCSLKQIYIQDYGLQISEELMQALAHSRSLTHMYLLNVRFSSCLKLEEFPRLCEFYANVLPPYPYVPWHSFKQYLQLNLDARGVMYPQSPKVDCDVLSLWSVI